jgi:tetratricopeptide (TPR) repeat protein
VIKRSLFGILGETEQQEREATERLREIENVVSTDPKGALQKIQEIEGSLSVGNRSYLYVFVIYLLGRCAYEQKKWRKAKAFLHEVVDLTSQKEELLASNMKSASLNDLGRIAFFEDRLDDALKDTQQGLSTFVKDGERTEFKFHLLLNKAIYLEKMNQPEKALETIEELKDEINSIFNVDSILLMVNLDVMIQMYNMYATLLNQLRLHEKALEYAQQGVAIAQKNKYFDRLLTLHTTLGTIYANLGKEDQSEKCFLLALDLKERATKEYPLVFVYSELSQLYIKRGKWQEAEKNLQQVIEISERNNDLIHLIEALIALGDCSVQQKRYDQAISPYKKAEELVSMSGNTQKESEIATNLGYCYQQLGDKKELEKYQYKVFQLNTKRKWG